MSLAEYLNMFLTVEHGLQITRKDPRYEYDFKTDIINNFNHFLSLARFKYDFEERNPEEVLRKLGDIGFLRNPSHRDELIRLFYFFQKMKYALEKNSVPRELNLQSIE
jgi:hypothetical protein